MPSSDRTEKSADFSTIAEMIRDIRVAMLATSIGDGTMHVRPMDTQEVEPKSWTGTLWFMTDAGSPKVDEVREDANAFAIYSSPQKSKYVVVQGRAYAERNLEQANKLWSTDTQAWWPKGPTDPGLMLIRFEATSAEFWDGPGMASYFFHVAKAVMKKERIEDAGEHGTISLGARLNSDS